MPRLSMIAALAVCAAAATLASAHDDAPGAGDRRYRSVTGIEWSYLGDDGGRLQFEREGMTVTLGADQLPEAVAALTAMAAPARGSPVAFALVREAGALACAGNVTERGAGGTCRFDPDEGFVSALAARGLVPERVEDLLRLALVDARVASVDELSRAGFAVGDVDELTTVAALGVTGAYAVELREAGLVPENLDELVSAKAVDIEPDWVAAMADAGFPGLGLDEAIELRALGVTPDYARRMARVMRATEGTE
jgi:hypothetical protein